MNAAQKLHDAGQRLWLDSINRTMPEPVNLVESVC